MVILQTNHSHVPLHNWHTPVTQYVLIAKLQLTWLQAKENEQGIYYSSTMRKRWAATCTRVYKFYGFRFISGIIFPNWHAMLHMPL